MYYTEEELLEAVDILVEEYGFYEDEAIDMICEAYEMELLDESKVAKAIFGDVVGARNKYVTAREKGKAALAVQSAELAKQMKDGEKYDPRGLEVANKVVDAAAAEELAAAKGYIKAGARAAAPVALAGGAATAGVLAHKAYKKNKAKKEAEARRRRTLRGRLSRR